MLKTIIFDLGNVLFFFDHTKMIRQIGHCCGIPPEALKKIFFQHRIHQDYEQGQINSEDVHKILVKHGTKPFTHQEWMEAASDIFIPNTDLWPTIEALKEKKIRLVLLSNTSEVHYNYLNSHYPILSLFDAKILSYEVKASKPQPQIFQAALRSIDCSIDQCFYTDDIAEFIAAARKEGIDGEIFVDVSGLKSHLLQRGLAV